MKTKKQKNYIILSGGGTGGSVTPLLAIAESLKHTPSSDGDFNFVFIGGKTGPEHQMAEKEKIEYLSIPSGKFRRYFSWKNFTDPFLIFAGFIKSIFILLRLRPSLIITAGSFVSVPVVWAAWLLRIPVLVHQQDIRPGLANKLMAPFAKVVTVTFEKSLQDYGAKAVWTGNPIRNRLKQLSTFNFQLSNLPTVLILGGGTGATAINELVCKGLKDLTKFCNIIHQTGKGKANHESGIMNYESFEFLDSEQIAAAYSAADIVVSRCGMGTLTELSHLGKASILIPMPDSHQEDNARIFKEKNAAVVLDQKDLKSDKFISEIENLIENKDRQEALKRNIKTVMKENANEEITNVIAKLIQLKNKNG